MYTNTLIYTDEFHLSLTPSTCLILYFDPHQVTSCMEAQDTKCRHPHEILVQFARDQRASRPVQVSRERVAFSTVHSRRQSRVKRFLDSMY